MITTEYAECDIWLLLVQYLTPQPPYLSFFQKDIRGDIDVGELDAIRVLRLGRY